MYKRVSILGAGLIGGSFALALRQVSPGAQVIGWDRPETLERARARGAIDKAASDIGAAVAGAELVFIALPVGVILQVLPAVARAAAPTALVTDAGSTKQEICRAAAEHFRSGARFLGGHPLAGKETGGMEAADAALFRGARYALIGEPAEADERIAGFVALLRAMGAEPVWLDAAAHDRAVAVISGLPQLFAVALAEVVDKGEAASGLPLGLAGPGLRDALRLAGSPYDIWRDICGTNRKNLSEALAALIESLEQIRAELADPALGERFTRANRLYNSLRKMQ
jgi:prephenate dehydrogenase